MRELPYRIFITLLNILLPPLAVGLLDGFHQDCLANAILFFLGVLPSHIHGFYISCVYFHRKKLVRKGRYPGGEKAFVFSPRITNGGASEAEVERLWVRKFGEKDVGGAKERRGERLRDSRGRSSRGRSPGGERRGYGEENGYVRDRPAKASSRRRR